MHPVLFELFGYEVPAFGVMLATAFLVALLWAVYRAKWLGENPDHVMEIAPWLIISALVGARLFYIGFFPEEFAADPLGTLLGRGGLVWYGGMVGAVVALIIHTRVKGIPFFHFTDIIAPPAALGLAIGRIGCFLAGCCFGGPCHLPWAVSYPEGHATHPLLVHPAPLYESAAAFVLAALLAWVHRKFPQPGMASWSLIAGYGVIRFFMEYVRGDRLIWLEALDLSASQIISLLGITLGIAMMVLLRQKEQQTRQQEG